MVPTLRFRLERVGFNEFQYRVIEIKDFPTELETRLYCPEHGDYIYMQDEGDHKSLVIESSSVGPKLLTEGKIAHHIHNETDLYSIQSKIGNYLMWFDGIIHMHNEHIKELGKDTIMEFNIQHTVDDLAEDAPNLIEKPRGTHAK